MAATVDTIELGAKVKEMYRHAAQEHDGDYHFELGERLALRVGYDADRLRNVPVGAVESFASVGFFFDLAALTSGETVVDLGSGSGMDPLYAADLVGPAGRVVGIDFTLEQLEKARKLAAGAGADHVEFLEGRIESLPLPEASVDCSPRPCPQSQATPTPTTESATTASTKPAQSPSDTAAACTTSASGEPTREPASSCSSKTSKSLINAITGELLRELIFNPHIDYQPTGAPKGPTRN